VSWDSVLLHLASFSQDIRACVHKKKVLPGAKAYAFGWVNSKAPWWDYLGTIEGTPKGIRFSAGHVLLYSKAKFIQEFKVYKKTYIPGIYAHIYGNGTSKWSSHK